MSMIVIARENSLGSLSIELLGPEASRDAANAACIARAIAQRMDPEWREFVAQEQLDRMVASFESFEGTVVVASTESFSTPV